MDGCSDEERTTVASKGNRRLPSGMLPFDNQSPSDKFWMSSGWRDGWLVATTVMSGLFVAGIETAQRAAPPGGPPEPIVVSFR